MGLGSRLGEGYHAMEDLATRFWAKVQKSDGCWEWTAHKDDHGYGQISAKSILPGTAPLRAHRYSYELAYGAIPDGLYVCHHCDNPGCVRPDHLFLGTQKDNMRDKVIKGRDTSAKLTPDQVRAIREIAQTGATYLSIARRFGVSHKHISRVVAGRYWNWLNDSCTPSKRVSGKPKLTQEQVAAIRAEAAQGTKQTTIATRYGITESNVSRIIRGNRWK